MTGPWLDQALMDSAYARGASIEGHLKRRFPKHFDEINVEITKKLLPDKKIYK